MTPPRGFAQSWSPSWAQPPVEVEAPLPIIEYCRQYNDGHPCPRMKKRGTCPYFHNESVRKESLKRKRIAKAARNAEEKKTTPTPANNVPPTPAQRRDNLKEAVLSNMPINTSRGMILKPINAEVHAAKETTQLKTSQPYNQFGALTVRNWKNDAALRASRIKLQEKYDQSKDNNLQSTLLQLVHILQPTKQPASPNGSMKSVRFSDDVQIKMFSEEIDLSCVANEGEVDERVLVPHEIVVGFINQLESKHNVVICRAFLKEACFSLDECPYSHEATYKGGIWAGMKKYMAIKHKGYAAVKFPQHAVFATKANELLDQHIDPTNTPNKHVTSDASKSHKREKKDIAYSPIDEIPTISKSGALVIYKDPPLPTPQLKDLSTPLNGNAWDNDERVQILLWARKNLNLETRAKFLKTYIAHGEIPGSTCTLIAQGQATNESLFPKFRKFPGEIQNKIWEMAIAAEPSTDVVIKQTWEYIIDGKKYGRKLYPIGPKNKFMNVCQVSRSLVLKYSQYTFGNAFHRPLTLFNYNCDRLFLLSTNWRGLCSMTEEMLLKSDRNRITQLMVPLRDYLQHIDTCAAITSFPNIKHVYFVVGDGFEDEPWSKDKNLVGKIKDRLATAWNWRNKKFWKKEVMPELPECHLQVIPANTAHKLGIDGIRWAR